MTEKLKMEIDPGQIVKDYLEQVYGDYKAPAGTWQEELFALEIWAEYQSLDPVRAAMGDAIADKIKPLTESNAWEHTLDALQEKFIEKQLYAVQLTLLKKVKIGKDMPQRMASAFKYLNETDIKPRGGKRKKDEMPGLDELAAEQKLLQEEADEKTTEGEPE
jgi:hypothetical protein